MEDEEVRKESGGLNDPPETIDTATPEEAAGTRKKQARTGRSAGKGGGKKGRKNGEKTGAAGGRARTKADPATVLSEAGYQGTGTEPVGESTVIVASAPSVSVFQGAKLQMAGTGKAVAAAPSGAVPQVQQVNQVTRIVKVHRIEAAIGSATAHVIAGKVLVQGLVDLQIFFVTDDDMVHHLAEEVPFSSMIEIPGAAPGMRAIVEPRVAAVLFHLGEDGTSIVKKVVLEIFVKVVEEVQRRFLAGSGPLLLLDEVMGEGTGQTLHEAEVALVIPAIKIEEIRGELRDVTAEVIPDKVIVQGLIHKEIFFVDTAGVARHQAEDVAFSAFVEIPGAAPGMKVQIQPRIESILFELTSPTVLREKVIIEIFAKVTAAVQFQAALGEGPLFRVAEVVGEGTGQILRRDLLTLDRPAQKIREIVATLVDVRGSAIPGKAIVQGTIHKQIFYVGTDDIEYHQAADVPFSLMVEIPGLERGVELVIEPIIASVLFDLVSPTQLEEKVIVDLRLTAVERRQFRLVTGNGPLVLAEQVVGENLSQVLISLVNQIIAAKRVVPITVVSTVQGEQVFRQQIIVENEVTLPVVAVKIAEVSAEIIDLRATLIPSGVLVEGTVRKDVKFVGEDDVVRVITENVPFSLIVNVLEGFTVESVEVRIEQILFSIGPDGRTVRQIIVLSAEVTAIQSVTEEFQLITELVAPGLAVQTVLVEEPVLTPEGIVLRQFPVITGISGPGLAEVVNANFGVHTLQVVGVGPQALNVLEGITLRDP